MVVGAGAEAGWVAAFDGRDHASADGRGGQRHGGGAAEPSGDGLAESLCVHWEPRDGVAGRAGGLGGSPPGASLHCTAAVLRLPQDRLMVG